MNRVYIKTYGCQMNERDSEAVGAMLRARGYALVDNEAEADVMLINTCSVRDQAEQKAIGKAGHVARKKRKNSNLIVGVMGCMAQNRGKALLDSLPDLDLIVGTQKFHQIPDHLDNLISTLKAQGPRPTTIVDLEEETGSQNTIKYHNLEHKKVSAFVSIMQGCNMNCAFCIVPTTRGEERSRPMLDILEEIEILAESGTKEVTLLGQIVTSYGRREIPFFNGKSPFVQLIEKVHEIKGIERIRFTSPHPRGFKQDLVEAYTYLPKLCPYVHLPLQSGSDRVLKLMNRPYSASRYKEIVASLREAVSNIYLSTDIIVGFPGETEEDFQLTYDLFEQTRFDMAYIFKYSIRTGTPAATMGEQVSSKQKEARNQALLQILERHSLERNQSLLGTVQEVLVEGPAKRGQGLYMGRNPGNRKVIFEGNQNHVGSLLNVLITDVSVSSLKGKIITPS